jgi:hypothetical protein
MQFCTIHIIYNISYIYIYKIILFLIDPVRASLSKKKQKRKRKEKTGGRLLSSLEQAWLGQDR